MSRVGRFRGLDRKHGDGPTPSRPKSVVNGGKGARERWATAPSTKARTGGSKGFRARLKGSRT